MNKIDLYEKAAKCFDSFDTYWRKLCAFRDDYLFFEMYMKRNSKSDVAFLPSVCLKSFQSVINDYPKDEDGLERAFNIFTITRQIILDLQEWNNPIYEESERNIILKELVKHEWVDIDLFCNDFIGCSLAHPEIRQKIDGIIKE